MHTLITLHPKLVHFPIALLFTAVFFELLYLTKKSDHFKNTSVWLYNLGLLSSVLAVAAGFLAADQLGHGSPGHEFVHEHRNLMVATTITWFVSALAFFFIKWFNGSGRHFRIVGYIAVAILMAVGADLGGSLVYQYGTGVNVSSDATSGHHHGDVSGESHHDEDASEHHHDESAGSHHDEDAGEHHHDESGESQPHEH